ncbi:hypothetical protein N657DRAFT_668975 [Parathielavia appendiculata]|uniref:Uncharacterized protein n=1 Tax=Parathielavia appendiculata TaxID=2587402 RepID=A0AAN6Z7E2_9PEZI|nr:hypothetical protein N657DRAFT_668975 [Parathielavia appendiculata]
MAKPGLRRSSARGGRGGARGTARAPARQQRFSNREVDTESEDELQQERELGRDPDDAEDLDQDQVEDMEEFASSPGSQKPREVRQKWRECHGAVREGTRVRKRTWNKLLQDTNRHYHVNPERLLVDFGFRVERSLGFEPSPRRGTPQVYDDEETDKSQESPLARCAKAAQSAEDREGVTRRPHGSWHG